MKCGAVCGGPTTRGSACLHLRWHAVDGHCPLLRMLTHHGRPFGSKCSAHQLVRNVTCSPYLSKVGGLVEEQNRRKDAEWWHIGEASSKQRCACCVGQRPRAIECGSHTVQVCAFIRMRLTEHARLKGGHQLNKVVGQSCAGAWRGADGLSVLLARFQAPVV